MAYSERGPGDRLAALGERVREIDGVLRKIYFDYPRKEDAHRRARELTTGERFSTHYVAPVKVGIYE